MIPNDYTKSEFLSFLYSERDREYAISQISGRNIWVELGSLVTLCIYLYTLLKEKASSVIWDQSCIIVSLGFLFIISYIYIIIKPRTRLFSSERIRTIKDEAPIISIVLQAILSLSICIWLYLCKISCFLYYCWMVLFVLKLITLIYISLLRNKFVVAELKMYPFKERWLNLSATAINYILICIISFHSPTVFKSLFISKPNFETFEFSVAVILIVIVLFCIIQTYTNNKKGIFEIDRIIDLYTFNKIDENQAYEQLISFRYGQTAVNALKAEIFDWNRTLKDLSEHKEKIIQITENLKTVGIINLDNFDSDYKLIIRSLIACKKALKKQKMFIGKIEELINLPNNHFLQEDIRKLLDIVTGKNSLIDEIQDLQDIVLKAYNLYIAKYQCTKCGGLCENFDCKLRHEKPHFKLIVKQRYWWLIRSLKLLLFRIKVNLKKD